MKFPCKVRQRSAESASTSVFKGFPALIQISDNKDQVTVFKSSSSDDDIPKLFPNIPILKRENVVYVPRSQSSGKTFTIEHIMTGERYCLSFLDCKPHDITLLRDVFRNIYAPRVGQSIKTDVKRRTNENGDGLAPAPVLLSKRHKSDDDKKISNSPIVRTQSSCVQSAILVLSPSSATSEIKAPIPLTSISRTPSNGAHSTRTPPTSITRTPILAKSVIELPQIPMSSARPFKISSSSTRLSGPSSSSFLTPTSVRSAIPSSMASAVSMDQPSSSSRIGADVNETIYGMPNIGNSCYVNAVLQVLFNLEFFEKLRRTLLALPSSANVEAPISMAILDVYKSDLLSRRDQLEILAEKIQEKSQLTRKSQEDAHELLLFLFTQFEKELKQLRKFMSTESPSIAMKVADKLVDTEFNYSICKVFHCDQCLHELKKTETGNHLILQLNHKDDEQPVTIADLLLNALNSEEGLIECDCGYHMRKKQHYFTKFPKYIVLTLTRYLYDNSESCHRKICTSVLTNRQINFIDRDYSEEDEFAAFLSDDEDEPSENVPPTPTGKVFIKEEEEEFSILKESVSSPKKKLCFTPVNHSWRERICKELGLEEYLLDRCDSVYELNRICDQPSVLFSRNDAPVELADVAGDGNCLFSSFSHIVTGGSFNAHLIIREKICDFLEKHEMAFRRYITDNGFSKYVQKMRGNGEWGTQTELFVFATLVETPIYTYFEGTWTCYEPRFKKHSGFVDDTTCRGMIYLSNTSLHFEPVLSIKSTHSYCIRGVINHIGRNTETGHYLSVLRKRERRTRFSLSSKGEKWLKCNDSTVEEIERKEGLDLCARSGYIFFYECTKEGN